MKINVLFEEMPYKFGMQIIMGITRYSRFYGRLLLNRFLREKLNLFLTKRGNFNAVIIEI